MGALSRFSRKTGVQASVIIAHTFLCIQGFRRQDSAKIEGLASGTPTVMNDGLLKWIIDIPDRPWISVISLALNLILRE